MKELRTISMSDVRKTCIENNWYTNLDCVENLKVFNAETKEEL